MEKRERGNVSQGGLFHTRSVDYSPEVQRLLKSLIEESKLSMIQRKKINDSLKNGNPLPLPPKPRKERPQTQSSTGDVKMIPFPRRRRKEQIVQSGAYDADDHFGRPVKVNYEEEKRRLQDLIAFGKVVKTNGRRCSSASVTRSAPIEENVDSVQRILNEIEERERFLKEMDKFGQANKYEKMVNQEIAAKIRSLEKLDPSFKEFLKNEYKQRQEIKATTASLFA